MPKRHLRSTHLLCGLLCSFAVSAAPAMAILPLEGSLPPGEYRDGSPACSSQVIRDYGRVFSVLPSLPRPSKDGRLSFGPNRIRFVESPKQVLVPGSAGSHAFSFSLTSHGAGDHVFRLNWFVSSRLVAIDRRGRSNGVVARTSRILRTVAESELAGDGFRLRVPANPGLYRAEITFKNLASGQQLGRVGQYIRVLRPRTVARLGIVGSSTVEPGGIVVVRFENLGTRQLFLPERYALDQYRDGYWQRDLANEHPDMASITRPIDVGLANKCVNVPVPADASSGLYRVRVPFFAGAGRQGSSEVIREFQVQ